ncbi:mite allergen Der f 3-like [Symsagittifera roscoffensis]|uniref:mite allergen Der f 3-like n=1 Tax=Symsagittifera roscoffensis TaxID=84072 RepID=UPI00307B646B
MIKWLVIILVLLSLQNHFGELTEAENFIEDQITGKIDIESGGMAVSSATSYPFYVYVRVLKDDNSYSSCGGTIVSKHFVITAAHCVNNEDSKSNGKDKTSLGSLTFDIDHEESHSKKYLVQHYYRFKNFDPNVDLTHGYDIVALKLKEEISFDNYRQKLNPCQGKVGSKDVDDNQVWAVGFGYTDSHGTRPDKLMEVQLNEVENSVCINTYSSSPTPPEGSQICTKDSSGKDTCQGDSGGPIFLVKPGTKKAICHYGVVSYGPGKDKCGKDDPSAASRVNYYINMFDIAHDKVTKDTVKVKFGYKPRNAKEFACMVQLATSLKTFSGVVFMSMIAK